MGSSSSFNLKRNVHKYKYFHKTLPFVTYVHWTVEAYRGVNRVNRVNRSRAMQQHEIYFFGSHHAVNVYLSIEINLAIVSTFWSNSDKKKLKIDMFSTTLETRDNFLSKNLH